MFWVNPQSPNVPNMSDGSTSLSNISVLIYCSCVKCLKSYNTLAHKWDAIVNFNGKTSVLLLMALNYIVH